MKLPAIISDEIARHGLSYRVENGGKHRKLYVEGKLICSFPFGSRQSCDQVAVKIRNRVRRLAVEVGRA